VAEPLERPKRLPLVATLTVWACHELTANEKIVWYHTWLLDNNHLDGCYMSSRSFGERLGLSPKTVEDIRARLVRHELLMRFDRPGTVQPGWVATMGASLIPEARDLPRATREAPALALKLDHRIASVDAGVIRPIAGEAPVHRRKAVPRGDGGRFRPIAEVLSVHARSVSMGLGGVRGGTPTSSSTDERTLPPAVTDLERQVGVGALAPKGEVGGETMAGLTEQERWQQLRARRQAQVDALKRSGSVQ
jgi:hypothetical protein